MDLPIGAEIVHEEKKYLVEESESCRPCAFFDSINYECRRPAEVTGHCSALLRKDGRDISFIRI